MSARASVLPVSPVMAGANARRTRALAVLLMAVIASIFWIDSRYPALMKRYTAGTHVKASGALTFGAVYQVTRDLPLRVRVWRTTVNWLDSMKIGMTFGVLFGALLHTVLRYYPLKIGTNLYLNSLKGALVGVPGGVSLCPRRAYVLRHAANAADQVAFPEHDFWRGRRGTARGMHQLHCADRSRTIRVRREHGIGFGDHVRLAGAECRCTRHELRSVSCARRDSETCHGAISDFCFCSRCCFVATVLSTCARCLSFRNSDG